ncbi:serine hydrolase [Mycobacterium sp. ACS4331]|uniref:serine hydrolase n=1 Tax=Mycobacterium sp. ACS4331 TaxID=1834121 RepID=UPI0007FD19AA|nr:serine hydrolase [Mycobacterium sp. ACS4331]OBF16467.1 serine hydrolase [Mycobacterium sp. ACS4331]
MPGPTRRVRTAAALALGAALVVPVVGSCAPADTPTAHAGNPGVRIATNTPQGVRAKQVMDMLNSDWPIGAPGVKTLAVPDAVDYVAHVMDGMWWERPYTLTGVDVGAGTATLHVTTSYGAKQQIELHTSDSTLVDKFIVTTQTPPIRTWADVDAALQASGARYSYRVSKVVDGKCEQLAGSNTADSLPLASIFKLYVLYAVAESVRAGTVSWDDELTITEEGKTVGSSAFDTMPEGSRISVRTAAGKMIANSDNMATDLLINHVGTRAVEQALVDAGHHDPGSMTPFPTMHELFSIGWGEPDLRDQWKNGSPAVRAELLRETKARPYEPDPLRSHEPASAYGAEWYGSAEDICRVHAALQTGATGAAAPVKEIMTEIPGIDLDRRKWPYIGAKAGNLPGELTFSWYAVDHTGQPWVLSLQTNWDRFHSNQTGGYLMSIIKQMFDLIPVG